MHAADQQARKHHKQQRFEHSSAHRLRNLERKAVEDEELGEEGRHRTPGARTRAVRIQAMCSCSCSSAAPSCSRMALRSPSIQPHHARERRAAHAARPKTPHRTACPRDAVPEPRSRRHEHRQHAIMLAKGRRDASASQPRHAGRCATRGGCDVPRTPRSCGAQRRTRRCPRSGRVAPFRPRSDHILP